MSIPEIVYANMELLDKNAMNAWVICGATQKLVVANCATVQNTARNLCNVTGKLDNANALMQSVNNATNAKKSSGEIRMRPEVANHASVFQNAVLIFDVTP